MKPIPAIDENGEFVEAELVNGIRVVVMALGEDYAHALGGNYVWRVSPKTFKDWPAVRERVERARAERERVAREAAKRLEAFGVKDRADSGVKVTYSPSGAASVDSRELFEKVIEPLLAESQKRQAIRAHAQVDEPRRPSFAEALEDAARDECRHCQGSYALLGRELISIIKRARELLGHADPRVTERNYRRAPVVVRTLK